ncbi:MAG: 16S rRNA (uracil(1498)-N(3))-methyltransferase [Phycisphaeraceae bacterium]|nr:16S rRNA (uracil(1498)-N(3))-methyltransferase [Phycisphaeraceae bacterium]
MVKPIDPNPTHLPVPGPASDPGPRFLCKELPEKLGSVVTLDKDQARHATRVLRLSVGDPVQLIDGLGTVAHATLAATDAPTTCTVQSIEHAAAPTPRIELATAIPKGPRADAMVNDLAQLGTGVLLPLIAERSVVVPRDNKLDRFAKASAEAGKQSGNAWFMQIGDSLPFAEALHCDAELKLIADPDAEPIADLATRLNYASTARVLIGPEGGFTDGERSAACQAGFTPWRFSPHTLRIETAAVAAVAVLRAQA